MRSRRGGAGVGDKIEFFGGGGSRRSRRGGRDVTVLGGRAGGAYWGHNVGGKTGTRRRSRVRRGGRDQFGYFYDIF